MASAANGRAWSAGERSKSEDELLVFGYSCKLFRDNEKALFIDRGKHLIPWMGDDSLMIDRYDARGHLHDLRQYEPKPGGVDYLSTLSDEERALEELCEEERYLALFRDLQEEAIYQEEEIKRLNVALNPETAHKEIAFSYDCENSAGSPKDKDDGNEAPFKVPRGLHIPPSVPTPPTMKLHAIIEKTAVFVSQHGPQMEIIIKTKQASNSQFDFLSFDHPLNIYYRFLVEQIKCGTYIPSQATSGNEDSEDDDDHYLHPSLLPAPSSSVLQEVSKVFSQKVGEDNAYSRLVKNLKSHVDSPGSSSPGQSQDPNQNPLAGQGGYAGYDAGGDYGSAEYASAEVVPPPPPGLEPILLPTQAAQMGYAVPPPPDVQPIIDKMATYVAKNGDDFEMVVKSKGDKRFEFLLPTHEYHTYYLYKKQSYIYEFTRAQTQEAPESSSAPEPAVCSAPLQPTVKPSPAPSQNGIVGMEDKLPPKFLLGDDGTESLSNSPLSTTMSSMGPVPTERSYAKGPVSFSLKMKDSDGKEKKCVSLVGGHSDSDPDDDEAEPTDANTTPLTVDNETVTAKADIPGDQDAVEKMDTDPTSPTTVAQDSVPSSRQIQLERKRRLAKFLTMIKDMPAPESTPPPTQTAETQKTSASPKDPLLILRSPSDSLPGSSPKSQRHRSGESSGDSPKRSRTSHTHHHSRSHSPGHAKDSHHRRRHDAKKRTRSRSRSRDRKHHGHRRSPLSRSSKRSETRTPSPSHRSKHSRSRSKSSRRK